MAEIRPIKALRYTEKAGDIKNCVCPPYDIISESERLELLESSPYNVIRLEKPVGEDRYEKAEETFNDWLYNGIIKRDEKEGIFVYREEFSVAGHDYVLTGLVCLVKLCDFSERVILPHEETLKKAKTDRYNLMCATNCNFSSVYGLYNDDSDTVSKETAKAEKEKPVVMFRDDENVTHTLWKIESEESIKNICDSFKDRQIFIADGHHRYETALRYRDMIRKSGSDDADYIMMTLVATDNKGLVVFPTHRMIVDMPVSRDEIIKKCSSCFDMKILPLEKLEISLKEDENEHFFAMYTGGDDFLLLKAKKCISEKTIEDRSEAYSDLDVSILHYYILEQALGIDKENMANQINLRYTRSYGEAIDSVRKKRAEACFIINPTKIRQIKAVSLAGDKMPQKSTYFYPKLKTGLVMNILRK